VLEFVIFVLVLIYEPTNSQALKFLPLLQEKKEQDEEAYEGDSSSGEHDSSDEDSEEGSDDEEGDRSVQIPDCACVSSSATRGVLSNSGVLSGSVGGGAAQYCAECAQQSTFSLSCDTDS